MKKNITIQIDTKLRELPYIVILKSLFEKNGGIDLHPTYQDPIWLNGRTEFVKTIKKKSNILVTPSYNSNRTHYTLAWKYFSNAKLVKWHSEQLFDKRFYNEKLNLNALSEYNRDVDFHIVWGKKLAELLVKKAKINPNRIYITGCPKFDLLNRTKESPISSSEDKKNKIVFVSDFTLANIQDTEYQKILKVYKYDKKYNLREFYSKAFNKFYNVIETIAKNHPSCNIIVRLHPGEPIEAYSKLLELNNIQISQHEPFSKIIAGTDVIAQFLSTSFFESVLAGKRVYCLDLLDDYTGHWREHYKYYNFVKPDKFINNFDAIQNNTFIQQTEQVEIGMRDLFSTHLGLSIPRTYYALCHILERNEGGWSNLLRDKARVTKTINIFYLKQLLANALFNLQNLGILKNKNSEYVTDNFYGSDEGFTKSEVDALVEDYINKNNQNLDEVLCATYNINSTEYGIEVSV